MATVATEGMMIVGIHQINYFPYAGIWERLRRCDRFVLLTWAQFSPGNYHNRFNFNGAWYTMSVNRGLEPLAVKRYVSHEVDWQRILARIPPAYRDVLAQFTPDIGESLAQTNIAIIRRLAALLGIETEIVLDYPTDLRGTARLVDLCQHYGATTYLSGPSGPKYLDMEQFGAAGIGVEVQQPGDKRAAVELLQERMAA